MNDRHGMNGRAARTAARQRKMRLSPVTRAVRSALAASAAMIALAGVSILYQTQTILRRYPEDAYVGAAVQLFASVMTLFWYVLRLFSRR